MPRRIKRATIVSFVLIVLVAACTAVLTYTVRNSSSSPNAADGESTLRMEEDLRLGLAVVSDEALPVSASIGVAPVETGGNTLADVYRAADHNMYREKRMVHARGADY